MFTTLVNWLKLRQLRSKRKALTKELKVLDSTMEYCHGREYCVVRGINEVDTEIMNISIKARRQRGW